MKSEILSLLQAFRSDDFYVGSQIPDKKMNNAMANYPIPRNEEILALIDATVFGSAKQGMAIGSSGIYWNNDWATESHKKSLSWEDLASGADSIAAKGMNLYLAPGCLFGMSGSSVKPAVLAELLRKVCRALGSVDKADKQHAVSAPAAAKRTSSNAVAVSEKSTPTQGKYNPRYLEVLRNVAKRHRLSSHVYLAPQPSRQRVMTITSICDDGIDPYSILVIVDNTFLQTGKDFLIVTDKEIISKAMMKEVKRFDLSDVRQIRNDGKNFYVNNYEFQFFDQFSEPEILVLIDFLSDIVPALKNELSASENTAKNRALLYGFGSYEKLSADRKSKLDYSFSLITAAKEATISDLGDETGALDKILTGHISIITKNLLASIDTCKSLEDILTKSLVLFVLLYFYSTSKFPEDVKAELGEAYGRIVSIGIAYGLSLKEIVDAEDLGFEVMDEDALTFIAIAFSGAHATEETEEMVRKAIKNAGASNKAEFFELFLNKFGVTSDVCQVMLSEAEAVRNAWMNMVAQMAEQDEED
ncbi:hypothetical protein [Sphaerotilus sp.]|uniref:hypothetical protein n=1 Tax=Sphaerotilus sp. TaxID=2093942 RepID=UPI00286DCF5D|nr:hypothetical protein [Sphaerotilus sp.]